MKQTKTEKLVFSMLMENTGIAMGDSGGGDGRHWQRNAKKDITKEPEVSLEYTAPCKSDDVFISVSLYHYLPTILELDDLCNEYNAIKHKDWDGETYGVSKAGEKWLKSHGFTCGESWNTYNSHNNLSQILQGTNLKRDGLGEGEYVLLQVHGGADVRGGYTDAKMFKYKEFQEYLDPVPHVWATYIPASAGESKAIDLDMREGGYGFVAADTQEPIDIEEGSIIKAGL